MKINLVTYSNDKYKKQQKALAEQAKIFFDGVFVYGEKWLRKTNFYLENKNILDQPRGAGYWLWKPFIILETFKHIKEGDVILYIDSSDTFKDGVVNFLKKYFKNSDKNLILTPGAFPQKDWTKKDCFVLMDCDTPDFHNVIQLEAGILCFKKCNETVELVKNWLEYCQNENIITDIQNIKGNNYEGFKDHRHDQSILTNLYVKNKLNASDVLRTFITCNVND